MDIYKLVIGIFDFVEAYESELERQQVIEIDHETLHQSSSIPDHH